MTVHNFIPHIIQTSGPWKNRLQKTTFPLSQKESLRKYACQWHKKTDRFRIKGFFFIERKLQAERSPSSSFDKPLPMVIPSAPKSTAAQKFFPIAFRFVFAHSCLFPQKSKGIPLQGFHGKQYQQN